MNEAKKLLWSIGSQIVSRALTVILGLVTIGVLTRTLGPDGFGQYTTIFAFLGFVGTLVDLGMYLVITRRISAGEDPSRILGAVLGFRLVSFAGLATVISFASLVMPYGAVVKLGIVLGTVSLLGITLNQALGGLFQARQRMDLFVIGDLVGRLVTLGLVVVLLGRGQGVLGAVWAVIGGYATNLAVTWIFAKRFVRLSFNFERALWSQILREALPVGVLIAFGLIYLRVDVVILSLFRPAHDVGIYGIASKVSEIISTIPLIIMSAMLPALSRSAAFGETARLRTAADDIIRLMVLIGLGLVVGTAFVADKVAVLVGGKDFSAAGLPLALVMVAVGLGFITAFFSHLMIAHGRQRKLIAATIWVALANILLNITFVPRYGYIASAWITVISEVAIVVWYGAEVNRRIGYRPRLGNWLRMLAPIVAMAFVLILFARANLLILLPLAIAVFAGTALLSGALRQQQLRGLLEKPPT